MTKPARGRVIQISVNPQGGVPKHRVLRTHLETDGVSGDRQRNKRVHGGPQRAVCLYSWEVIRELQDEGHPIDCGTTGENLTLSGVDWAQIRPGVRLRIGEGVLLEIASYTTPCRNIAASFVDGEFKRIGQKTNPGWSRVYARVLQPGEVGENDEVEIVNA